MRLEKKRTIFFILLTAIFIFALFSTLFIVNVNSQSANSSGVVLSYNKTIQEFIADDSPDNVYPLVSFWQLPLWVQLAFISFTILAVIGLVPFVFGRLKHVLENSKTKNIFHYIQNNPGLTIQQLSDEQNINRGTLKYHLSQLFSNNKIKLIRKGKVSQLYHKTLSPLDKENIIGSYLRRNDNSRAILFTIMDKPGVTNKDLSEKFSLDKSTITDYLKKFLDDDIVEFRQDGKLKRCYMMQDARLILLRYKPQ